MRLMAENGNLNNNNTLRNINNTVRGEHSTTNSTCLDIVAPTTTYLDQGQSERDATHFRLREGNLEGFEYITCQSCGETFRSSSLLHIYDHYRERVHVRHFSNCLYCQGKVYQYFHNDRQILNYYHNCLRWKRGEDH